MVTRFALSSPGSGDGKIRHPGRLDAKSAKNNLETGRK
jgi:hypothetical protein